MNNTATNDAKRAEMAQLVTSLLRHGWTRSTIAQRLGVSPGTVGAWGRGKSMGTNAQRAEIRAMLEKALADEEKNDPTPPESCSPDCPGWVNDVTGALQACDACGRFKLPGGGSDDDAAKAAHDARFKDEDCPDCDPDGFADGVRHVLTFAGEDPGASLSVTIADITGDGEQVGMLGTVYINGRPHHVQAIRVKRDEAGIQQPDPADLAGSLYLACANDAETDFQTVEIATSPGEYVVIITPHGD